MSVRFLSQANYCPDPRGCAAPDRPDQRCGELVISTSPTETPARHESVRQRRSVCVVLLGFAASMSILAPFAELRVCAAVQEVWFQRHVSPTNYPHPDGALAWDRNANLLIVSSFAESAGFRAHFSIAKYSGSDGHVRWERRSTDSAIRYHASFAMALDGIGNVVVTRVHLDEVAYNYASIAKYASTDGSLLWEQYTTNGFAWSRPCVATDSGGNVLYVEGNIWLHAAKYSNASGSLVWEQLDPWGGDYEPIAAIVDHCDDVLVAGTEYGFDIPKPFVAKYAGTDGTLIWERGPSIELLGYLYSAAVDQDGNIVVAGTGFCRDFPNNSCMLGYSIAKYRAEDGELLWERGFDGPASGRDEARSVVVDSMGNVIVTGSLQNTNALDCYTVKFSGTDGGVLWEQRHVGSACGDMEGRAVAVDSFDNVVVSGNSINCSGNTDIFTVKYAAATGALLWEKRYNGPANGDDRLSPRPSLALDPNGRLAVAGLSQGESADLDFLTVVYRETLSEVAVEFVPAGMAIRSSGVPGQPHVIERAPSVTGPWTPLATLIAPPGGALEYVDTAPPAGTAFYRTRTP